MATIRAATAADVSAVSEYLARTLGGEGGSERFRRLCDYSWCPERPNVGFLIEDEGKVRGFIGAMYSERVIRGRRESLCNIHSWNVDEEHRKLSLHLCNRLLKQGDYTFTCFSPSERVVEILTFFKFATWPVEKLVFTPLHGLRRAVLGKGVEVFTPGHGLEERLDDAQRRIFEDHGTYRCGHVLLSQGNRRSYVVTVRRHRGRRAFAEVLYASDPSLLFDGIAAMHLPMWRAHRTVIIGVDQYLVGRTPPRTYVYRGLRPLQYRSSRLTLRDVDMLYSELVPMYA